MARNRNQQTGRAMSFQIPNHDGDALKNYSAAGLTDLRRLAAADFEALKTAIVAANNEGTVAATEDLDRSDALYNFIIAADAQLDALEAETAKTVTAATRDLPVRAAKTAETVTAAETVEATEVETAAVVETVTAANTRITVTDIANEVIETAVKPQPKVQYTIVAGAETGVNAGAQLADMAALTSAFITRVQSYGGASKLGRKDEALQHTVAKIKREFAPDRTYRAGMSEPQIWQMGKDATDEKLLEGGSLVKSIQAGVGWCAPSETIYSTCSQITASGLINLPEIGATRGGIRHNQGIDFSTIFGGGTGYNILTEAQVIADTAKTCVQVPCPSFVDDRLKVAALCITGDLLQNVGYPEFVQTFIEGAIAAQAHNVNRDIIATIVAGSTAVNLTTVDPWVSDNSVVSQVMSAAELAVTDIRYRLRLDPNQTIEMVFPFWVRPQMRADWIRRNAAVPADMVDGMIAEMFATRGVVAQYVYDWQDAFSGLTTTGPGAASPLLALPASPTVNLQFLAYPAGTWLLAREDVIRLDSVYDSTLLSTNKVTQLFVEDGYLPMRMCPLSRVYTVNICPNGKTGLQRDVTCTDVTP